MRLSLMKISSSQFIKRIPHKDYKSFVGIHVYQIYLSFVSFSVYVYSRVSQIILNSAPVPGSHYDAKKNLILAFTYKKAEGGARTRDLEVIFLTLYKSHTLYQLSYPGFYWSSHAPKVTYGRSLCRMS